jgi:RNA polymerase-binding transcription factor DksA
MSENRTIHLVAIPIGGSAGLIWNRLHGEREDICEALVKDSESASEATVAAGTRQELLQARLRKIDDALDRLMSGSYGNCSRCGRSIDDEKLDIDPALALCLDCSNWAQGDVALETLKPFDTLLLQTHHSDYRILLLDPKTGRALVEGGDYLVEPSEALVRGSAASGSAFKAGSICVGCRLEMWVNEKVYITSPVKSIEVKHGVPVESLPAISEVVH